ncbi:MAG: cobalamin B12-binding domain-containing protein [Planctomycetes bacterium]|nr:cobalamin B12-binding domain-containing protein [Planctomycetota bacterium]MBI3836085.1 cobalamin B12-binding domain-containing protein [Planctomycetota bacterium]
MPSLPVISESSCCSTKDSAPGSAEFATTASRRLRVLLINPPRFSELIGKNPAIVEKHRGFNPPLGILSLAGYLEKHSNHHIELIDAQPKQYTYSQLEEILQDRRADVVGITAMTFTLIDVFKTVRLVKKVMPAAKIVLGGPHVHLYPEESIRHPEVDFLVQGEGEVVFLQLLSNLDNASAWQNMKGLVYRHEADKIVNTGIASSSENLDDLGIPARHLLNVRDYTSLLGRDNVITTMFTSRGCPYRCTFCDRPYSPVLSGFRCRSAGHVADEMETCLALGINEAFIYDDTFTVRRDRVFELCDEIDRRKIKFRWDVRAHVNTMTPDLLRRMKQAGCDRIHYGVECGNDRMLKVIKKNATIAKVREVVAATKAVNMEVLTYFIIGQQSETASDIADSVRLARELDPNYVHFTIFCPYPGTEIYFKGLESGVIKQDVWREFASNPHDGFELPVWEENFTRQELREMLVKCYKSFYLRPRYVARSLLRIRRFGELKRKLRAGLSVVTMSANQKLYDPSDMARRARTLVPMASYDMCS